MKKIKVAIAGFPGDLAMAVSGAVCQSGKMELFNHGLSEASFANRHLQISCVHMEMYNGERKSLFFEKVKQADILVDCFTTCGKDNAENLTFYNKAEIPVIILTSIAKEKGLDNILNEILIGHEKCQPLRII